MAQLPTRAGVAFVRRFPGRLPALVCLHGFSLDGRAFLEFARLTGHAVLAVDLPGHGGSAAIAPSIGDALEVVEAALEAAGPPSPLLGYSQGGRIALRASLARPDLVSALVLVSCGAGIEDPLRRRARQAIDEARARFLEREGIEGFVNRWSDLPILGSEEHRTIRLDQDPESLAGALRALGQGAETPVWDRLGDLSMPVLVLAGELDQDYAELAGRMAAAIPNGVCVLVRGAGHAILSQRPEEAARLVDGFLTDMNEPGNRVSRV